MKTKIIAAAAAFALALTALTTASAFAQDFYSKCAMIQAGGWSATAADVERCRH